MSKSRGEACTAHHQLAMRRWAAPSSNRGRRGRGVQRMWQPSPHGHKVFGLCYCREREVIAAKKNASQFGPA